jgi:CheY-like chemotaxis protein
VEAAASTVAAMEILEQKVPDLIIADIGMAEETEVFVHAITAETGR